MASKYDSGARLLQIQSMLTQLIAYILEAEKHGWMSTRTKNELLKIIEGGTK